MALSDKEKFTAEQAGTVIRLCRAIMELIDELGTVPSGELYARLMEPLPSLTLETYMQLIDLMEKAGRIKVSNHLIKSTKPRPATP